MRIDTIAFNFDSNSKKELKIILWDKLFYNKENCYYPFNTEHPFSVETQNEFEYIFDKAFAHKNGNKINTCILIKDGVQTGEKYFLKLNFYNRLKLRWMFNKHWLQQPSNIMWLINICVALIAASGVYKSCSHNEKQNIIINIQKDSLNLIPTNIK